MQQLGAGSGSVVDGELADSPLVRAIDVAAGGPADVTVNSTVNSTVNRTVNSTVNRATQGPGPRLDAEDTRSRDTVSTAERR